MPREYAWKGLLGSLLTGVHTRPLEEQQGEKFLGWRAAHRCLLTLSRHPPSMVFSG